MKALHTIDTNTLETVSGGWHRHHRWHRGYRGATIVNNYWGGAQPAAAPQASFSMQMSSTWR